MLYDPNWKAPEVKLEPWQQLLLKAADLIEEKGWIQYAYHSPDEGYCVMGAISASLDDRPFLNEAVQKLSATLPNHTTIEYWNDYVATNQEQAITQLRKAAHAL